MHRLVTVGTRVGVFIPFVSDHLHPPFTTTPTICFSELCKSSTFALCRWRIHAPLEFHYLSKEKMQKRNMTKCSKISLTRWKIFIWQALSKMRKWRKMIGTHNKPFSSAAWSSLVSHLQLHALTSLAVSFLIGLFCSLLFPLAHCQMSAAIFEEFFTCLSSKHNTLFP